MAKTEVSKAWSFELFNLIRYTRGRKKSLIASFGGFLGALSIGQPKLALIVLLAGLAFEGILSIAEYWVRKVPKHD